MSAQWSVAVTLLSGRKPLFRGQLCSVAWYIGPLPEPKRLAAGSGKTCRLQCLSCIQRSGQARFGLAVLQCCFHGTSLAVEKIPLTGHDSIRAVKRPLLLNKMQVLMTQVTASYH